jgi:hypothetical protein
MDEPDMRSNSLKKNILSVTQLQNPARPEAGLAVRSRPRQVLRQWRIVAQLTEAAGASGSAWIPAFAGMTVPLLSGTGPDYGAPM